jgi:hypothetical protein
MSVGAIAEGSAERHGASARLLAAILTLSFFAAWIIPGNRLGLGAVLVAVGIAATAWTLGTPPRPATAAYSALALALASMAAIRSAEWVVAIDSLAAVALATVAVVPAATWEEIARAPVVVASRAIEATPFLLRGTGRLTAGRRLSPAFRGAVLGVVMIAVFGGLFISADKAFAVLAHDFILPDIDLSLLPARIAVFVAVTLMATALVTAGPRFTHLGPPRLLEAIRAAGFGDEEEARHRWPGLAPVEWTVALGLLDLLFIAFVGVQVAVLFAGHDYVLQTAGLTYAEYARQGFFQLVAAAALTLVVVALASRWARRRLPRDYRTLDILLGVLLVLTLVVLASALRRLVLYEEAFGFTRLRISVHAVILWMAGLLVMVIAAGALRRTRWLPRTVIGFSAAGLLAFSLSNPEGLIADQNVERYRQTGRVDLDYLAALSPDAVPALASLPENLRACVLEPHIELFTKPDSWPGWNLGRARARATLKNVFPSECSG